MNYSSLNNGAPAKCSGVRATTLRACQRTMHHWGNKKNKPLGLVLFLVPTHGNRSERSERNSGACELAHIAKRQPSVLGFVWQSHAHAVCNSPWKEKNKSFDLFFFGTPMGNRTPDSAVRGRRLNRLTMRAFSCEANQRPNGRK